MPIPDATSPRSATRGWLDEAHVLEDGRDGASPSSTGSTSRKPTPRSLVTVQDPNGAPDKSATGEKILALLATSSSSGAARMRFASLGSGSEGNGLVVEAGGTRILIDCGFGVRDTARASRGSASRRRSLVGDPRHARACRPRRRRAGVRRALRHPGLADVRHAGRRSASGSRACRTSTASTATTCSRSARSRSRPFPVPHDAREPVQFVVSDGARAARRADRHRHVDAATSRRACPAAMRWCSSATTISTMLANGNYPPSLKQRIAGRFGHLHNDAAARLLRAHRHHAARSTSSPRIFRSRTTRRSSRAPRSPAALGCAPDWIGIADQATGFDWREM